MQLATETCFELKISFDDYRSRETNVKADAISLIYNFAGNEISIVDGFVDGMDHCIGSDEDADHIFGDDDATPVLCYASNKNTLERLSRILATSFPYLKMSIKAVSDELWRQPWQDLQDVVTKKFVLTACPVVRPGARMLIQVGHSETVFGDGRHVTTRLLLKLLESRFIPGRDVGAMDIGTGNAVLAIALAKLGAESICATDIDEHALSEARLNTVINKVERRIDLRLTSEVPNIPASVITCNILVPELLRMIPKAYAVLEPGGELLLAGFNELDLAHVMTTCSTLGLTLREKISESGWLALAFSRSVH